MNGKPWWQSKSILSGIAQELIGAYMNLLELIQTGTADWIGIALIITGTTQIILRLVTNQPITKE